MEIKIKRKVLEVNDSMADQNRRYFKEKEVYVINVMSSPGSGKTETLVKTLKRLMPDIKTGVIVGDVSTENDADRLAVSGAPVIQITTDVFGGDCHLAAHVIKDTAEKLDLDNLDLLIIENIGNLVCPAEFDIGENARVVVISVTEGEDKPLKYPQMFRICDITLYNKVDLLPHLDGFDMTYALDCIEQVHPEMPVYPISAKTEDGFDPWINWIKKKVGK